MFIKAHTQCLLVLTQPSPTSSTRLCLWLNSSGVQRGTSVGDSCRSRVFSSCTPWPVWPDTSTVGTPVLDSSSSTAAAAAASETTSALFAMSRAGLSVRPAPYSPNSSCYSTTQYCRLGLWKGHTQAVMTPEQWTVFCSGAGWNCQMVKQ